MEIIDLLKLSTVIGMTVLKYVQHRHGRNSSASFGIEEVQIQKKMKWTLTFLRILFSISRLPQMFVFIVLIVNTFLLANSCTKLTLSTTKLFVLHVHVVNQILLGLIFCFKIFIISYFISLYVSINSLYTMINNVGICRIILDLIYSP